MAQHINPIMIWNPLIEFSFSQSKARIYIMI